jgi:hypothetical protein
MALVATVALALALPFALLSHPQQRPTAHPAQPAPIPEIAKPHFRFSKM